MFIGHSSLMHLLNIWNWHLTTIIGSWPQKGYVLLQKNLIGYVVLPIICSSSWVGQLTYYSKNVWTKECWGSI